MPHVDSSWDRCLKGLHHESNNTWAVFTARRRYDSAVLGVVNLSVGPSDTHVRRDKIKQCTAGVLILHERAITLVFWHPSVWNLRSKWPTPFEKRRLRQTSDYNVSTIRDSETSSLRRIESWPRAIDGVHTLPLSPQKVNHKAIFCFSNKIQVQSNKVCYKVSLCENFTRQS